MLRTDPPPFSVGAGALPVAGGCAATQAYLGGVSAALAKATGGKPPETPYVLARPPVAAAFLFSSLLHPLGSRVVWAVRGPRSTPLSVEVRPVGQNSRTYRFDVEADAGPGETYSGTVMSAGTGCYHFTLRWGEQVAEMELEFLGP